MRHDEMIEEGGERTLASGQGADLAAFYDRRAAAALAYCSRLCAPEAIGDAVEAAFARVFEASAAGEASDEESLDRRLRSAVRSEAASRASAATAGMPARRLLERLADPSRGGACELMPALLAARADGLLGERDGERMQAHLRRCAECRTAEHRFNEAERAFAALAGDDAPALGRSLLAEMLADAPLSDRRRFARERLADEAPDWLEEIDWEDEPRPRVVPVPDDALEPAHEEPFTEEPFAGEPFAEEPEQEPELQPEPEPEPATAVAPPPEDRVVHRNPALTGADTAGFPVISRARLRAGSLLSLSTRARRRIAIAMLVLGVLLLTEAALTVMWKEPFTAFLASRSQDNLNSQLHKLDSAQLSGADQRRLAAIRNAEARTNARMAALARGERGSVPVGGALGTIGIRRLGVQYVVVQGTDAATLRKGPGHYMSPPQLPGEGATVGIAGHRTTYGAPFRRIDELRSGDTITMKMPYGLFTYTVDRRRIVPAGFRGAFAGGTGERLVLSACHPLYSASQRILVYAHLVSRRPLGAAVETRAPAPTGPSARELVQRRTAARLRALGTRALAAGMTGPDVKEVQRLLGLPATGTFGPETTAAVTDFQRSHGLPPIGRVGSRTKAALAHRTRIPAKPPTPPPVAPQRPPGQSGGTRSYGRGYTQPGGTQGGYRNGTGSSGSGAGSTQQYRGARTPSG